MQPMPAANPSSSAISPDDLWQSIKKGRTARLDWLGENAPIDSIAATLTAMANSRGGTLVVGVLGPTGTLVGIRDMDNVIDRVLQAALSIDPSLIVPMPQPVQMRDRPVLIVRVPERMPHVYALDGRYLYRQGAENATLKPRDLRHLIIERGEASFETEIARDASMDDFDWDKVTGYAAGLGMAGDISALENLLIKRGCAARQDDDVFPTNAGILLFGKEPQYIIRGAIISAARFAGDTLSDKFTRFDITGTLPDQIRKAETFLIDNLRRGIQLGRTMARDENYEYPLEAARELVVNAVAHRDYSIAGDEIRLFIFSDRMEVTSPGGLPGHVTINNIKDERFSRNPVIVQVLSDMRFIERLGYGVDRVYDLMREQSLQPPLFIETAGGFRVTLYNQAAYVESTRYSTTASPQSFSVSSAAPIVFNGEYKGIAINPRQETALTHLHLGNTRITNSDLQALCPDVHTETIRRDLADLVAKRILKKLGEKRGSYYVLNPDLA
jgi:ATP-dependent DNA helicase RecG